ncbi:MAG: hypothetical protein JW809_14855 [Pirellulales bacterium]|nr:hypothetical protein [Pirellulales bacterium]
MRKPLPCFLAAAVFLVAAAAAAAPVAKITGPTESLPGDLVVLKTDGTVGAGFAWTVDGPDGVDARWFATDGGKNVVFAARTPGRYLFVLAVCADGQVAQTKHVLLNQENGPGPNPTPNPYPPPSAALRTLVDPVTAALGGIPRPDAKAVNVRLAAVFHRCGTAAADAASTGALRQKIIDEGRAEFGADLLDAGQYDRAEAAIEAALRETLTLENRAMDADLKAKAAAVLEAIAWACWEASR